MAGIVSKVHGWGAYAAASGQAGHGGGVCRRWCKAKAVAIGTECHMLGSVGVDEELYMTCMPVMAVRHKWQGGWQLRGEARRAGRHDVRDLRLYTISV